MRHQLLEHPRFAGRVRMASTARPAGDEEATALTVGIMSRLIREDSQSALIRRIAMQAIAPLSGRDEGKEIEAVFRWVKQHVRFVEDAELAAPTPLADPRAAEILVRPVDLVTMPEPAGDCDDFVMLTAALLRALGIRSHLVTIAADSEDPARYSHVYLEALPTTGGAIALDTSHGPYPGWSAPAAGKTRRWSIDDVKTLGAIDWGKLIEIGAQAGSDIARSRFGQPPKGTYIQDGEKVIYRPADGQASPLSFPTTQITGGGTGTLLLALGAVAVLALVLTRK